MLTNKTDHILFIENSRLYWADQQGKTEGQVKISEIRNVLLHKFYSNYPISRRVEYDLYIEDSNDQCLKIPRVCWQALSNDPYHHSSTLNRLLKEVKTINSSINLKVVDDLERGKLKMTFHDRINAVSQKARSQNWTYPQLFDALKAEGVKSYKVDVRCQRIEYWGDYEHAVHDGPSGFNPPVGTFNESQVIVAIRRTQRKETDYPTFLKEILAAGIRHYHVDMKERTVSYFGIDPTNKYVEKVP